MGGSARRGAAGLLAAGLEQFARGPALRGAETVQAAWDEIGRAHPGRRRILYYWTEAGLPLMLYGFRNGSWLGRDLVIVHDETLGGRVTAALVRRMGRPLWRLRHRRQGEMARDLGGLIRDGRPVALAVDGRGPYGSVGPEFARFVAGCDAIAVPLGVRMESSVRLRLTGPIRLPRRGAEVELLLGEPLDSRNPSGDLRGALEEALEAVFVPRTEAIQTARAARAGA